MIVVRVLTRIPQICGPQSCELFRKSGKDYTVHSDLNNLLGNPDYHIPSATVLSNEREISHDSKVTYMPVYLVMFMESDAPAENESEYIF